MAIQTKQNGKPAKKAPSHVKIANDLGASIVTGKRPPGSLLPSELELADDLGVSRSVVREALRMLSAKGLLESKPKTGTRVRERSDWNMLDPTLLAWMFETVPSASFVRNLFELRMIVEPAAAQLAARKRSAQQLSIMGHSLENMAIHTLATAEGQLADQRFHAAILEATDNELMVNLSATIGAAVRWTTFFKYRSGSTPRDPIHDHRRLFQAIAEGNEDNARMVAIELIEQAEHDTDQALKAVSIKP